MPWQYGASHSQAVWECKYLGVMTIKGLFTGIDVRLDLAGDDPSRWTVAATIDAASIDSGLARRDDVLRGPDYLDAERYPTLTFQSARVERQGDRYRVAGDLTIHGVTRPITLDLQDNGEGVNRRGERSRALTTEVSLNRLDYGVGPAADAGTAIGQEVRIWLQIEVVWQD
ncbi:MAG TPA: YceI family protein [Chloroflexota bacterium]|nr:YceI family protein [Chloroflexota bacterium]